MIISGGIFEANNIEDKIKNFNKELEKEDFWKNKISAQKILKEKKFIDDIYKGFNYTVSELNNLELLLELAAKENDNEVAKDCDSKINLLFDQIKRVQVSCFLSAENDHLDTYLEIHAGAGGTESQDWAQMLRRMYARWTEKKNIALK